MKHTEVIATNVFFKNSGQQLVTQRIIKKITKRSQELKKNQGVFGHGNYQFESVASLKKAFVAITSVSLTLRG